VEARQAKGSRKARRTSATDYRAIFDAVSDAILIHDPQTGAVLDVNRKMCDMFGYSREEALGLNVADICGRRTPCTPETLRRVLAKAVAGESQPLEWQAQAKDGRRFWTEVKLKYALLDGQERVLAVIRDISKRKQVEEALRQSEARYRAIVEDQTEMVARCKPDFTLTFLNEAGLRTLRQKPEEVLGQSFMPLIYEEDRAKLAETIAALSPENPLGSIEVRTIAPDGEVRWEQWSGRAIFDARGNPSEFQAVGRDVTDRRRAEEALKASEAKFRTLVEQIPAITYLAALDDLSRHIYISPQIETVLGFSPEEWLADPESYKNRLHPGDRDRVLSELILSYSQGGPFLSEHRMLAKSGRVVWVREESRAVFDARGLPLFMQGVALVITPRKEAEEALREANSRLQALVQASPLAILSLDANARVTSWNPAAERIFGWRSSEVMGGPYPIVPEGEKAGFRWTHQQVMQGKTLRGLELSRQRSDGTPVEISLSAAPLKDAAGSVVGGMGILEDITARKRTEVALRESEARFRGVFEGAGIGIALVSLNGKILETNRALREISGYSVEEWRQLKVADLTHPDERPEDQAKFGELLAGRLDYHQMEKRLRHRQGHWVWVRFNASLVRNAAGVPQFAIATLEDDTEWKRAEARLRGQAELLDLANDAILVRAPDNRLIFWNRGAEETYGWSRGEALGKVIHDLLATEFPKPMGEIEAEVLEQGQWQGELIHSRRDGQRIAVASRWALRCDAQGRPSAILEINRDITERRRAERAADEIQRQQEAILSNIPDIAWLKDGESRYIMANETFETTSGISTKDLSGKRDLDIWPPSLARRYRRDDLEVMRRGTRKRLEEPLLDKTGNMLWVETIKTPIFNDQGQVIGTTGIARDITQRRRMEEALRKFSRALKAITECHQALLRVSQEGELLDEICRIIVEVGGYLMAWVGFAEADEARSVRPVAQKGFDAGYIQAVKLTWGDSELGQGPVGVAIRSGQPAVCQDTNTDPRFVPWRAQALERGYASLVALPLKDSRTFGALAIYAAEAHAFDDEEIALLVGLANDLAYGITALRANAERRRAEAALRESEEKYHVLMDYSGDAILLADLDGNLTEANRQAAELLGYPKKELLQMHYTQIHPPEDLGELAQIFEGNKREGLGPAKEARVLRKDGAIVPVEITGTTIEYAGKKLVQGIFRDIKARKQAEEALRASELKLRLLTSQLLTIQEKERRRVSRELHDELGQALTVLKIHLVAIENQLRQDQQGLKGNCEQLLNYIDGVIENVRRLSWDLSPSILEDLGLSSSLGYLIDESCRNNNLSCTLAVDDIDHLFSTEASINIYRIFQESLTNTVKHAQASHISVAIHREGDRVAFSIQDNGKGFDPEKVMAREATERGLGLTAMNERALMAGGSLTIRSQQDQGTQITFHIPIDR
jgi:PAS domain S-box-containing protein